MELPSILNWKTDSFDVAKSFQEVLNKQNSEVQELLKKVKPGDYTAWDLVVFAYIQLIPGLLNANVHAQVRTTELLDEIAKLNTRLEGLTKLLIWLTAALILLTIALFVVTLIPLLHPGGPK
jgi:hypothetical protein